MPKLVKAPLDWQPGACLVTGRDDGDIIDFEREWNANCDPRIYIKAAVVEDAARELLEMAPRAELEAVQAELDLAREELAVIGGVDGATGRLREAFDLLVDQRDMAAENERLNARVAELEAELAKAKKPAQARRKPKKEAVNAAS